MVQHSHGDDEEPENLVLDELAALSLLTQSTRSRRRSGVEQRHRLILAVLLGVAGCASDVHTVPPTAEQLASPDPAPSQLSDVAWTHLELAFRDQATLVGFALDAGTMDGGGAIHIAVQFQEPLSPSDMFNRALPSVARPADGLVAYGFWNGERSEVHTVDIATGADATVVETADVVHGVALAPGGAIYFLALDSETRAEKGIFRSGSGEQAVQVIGPRQTSIAPGSLSRLLVTPDGQSLLTHDCTPTVCTLRLYEAREGRSLGESEVPSQFLGLTESSIAFVGGCLHVCPAQALTIPGLAPLRIGQVCGAAVLTSMAGAPVIVSGQASGGECLGGPGLTAHTLEDELQISLASQELAVVEAAGGDQVAPLDGWVVLARNGTLAPNANGGEAVFLNLVSHEQLVVSLGP